MLHIYNLVLHIYYYYYYYYDDDDDDKDDNVRNDYDEMKVFARHTAL